MSLLVSLRLTAVLALVLGAAGALAGLFWTPPGAVPFAPDLYGAGLYRRDTPFTAGGAQGSDLITLLLVLPAGVWALAGSLSQARRLTLIVTMSWLLYLSSSMALGAIAFNELFPIYVLTMPMAALALILGLHALGPVAVPRWVSVFLLLAGIVTAAAWALLLYLEMETGAFPPRAYYTARTTYALDLGVLAPGCIAAAIGLWRSRQWGLVLAVPLLGIAVLLLPMMLAQTVMQIRAGVAFGPEAAAPFIGFSVISIGAGLALWRMARPAGSRDANRV